jgi:diacylglycerol kinase family enzyme
MKVVVIYNPASGSEYSLRKIRQLFKEAGLKIDYSFTIKQLSSQKLAMLIKRGVTVAVVGGDGSMNSVARLLVGTKSVLLPLPGGTFNHFIRDLGMAPTVEEVLKGIDNAETHSVDVAYVNDELFLNNSNLGLYPFSLIERKTTKKLIGKWMAAGLSIVDQLSLFRRHSLVIDGEKVKSPFVFVGNNRYDIKQSLIPRRTGFSKNELTVMIATSRSRSALIRAIFAVLKGNVSHREDFNLTYRKTLSIYSHRASLPVSFDGEVKRLNTPLIYRVEPKSLKVLIVKLPN